MRESDFAKLLQAAGANLGIFVLSLVGLAVAVKLTWGPLFFFLFIISLFQGGLMIPAFKPACSRMIGMTLRDKVIGWTGFVGWFFFYLLIAAINSGDPLKRGFWIFGIALLFYFLCHTLALSKFYRQCFGFPSQQPARKVFPKTDEEIKRGIQEKEQQMLTEQNRQTDQQKRDQARLHCLLLYDEHAQNLTNRFPRERLVEYFSQYLTDSLPVELVEQRSELLKEMIESSMDSRRRNNKKFSCFNDIAIYFQEQKQEIESLNYDDATKQSFLSSLHHQEDVAIREFLS